MPNYSTGITQVLALHSPNEGRNIWNQNFQNLVSAIDSIIISANTEDSVVIAGDNIDVLISGFTTPLIYEVSLSDNVIINSLSSSTISADTYFIGNIPFTASTGGLNIWSSSTTINSIIANNGSANFAGEFSIVGGKNNSALSKESFIGGGSSNLVNRDFSSVVGGVNNQASGLYSFVGGGFKSIAIGNYSSVVGGQENLATEQHSLVSGGFNNLASGHHSSVIGGRNNISSGSGSTVIGGFGNNISGENSVILGASNFSSSISNTVFVPNINIISGGKLGIGSTGSANSIGTVSLSGGVATVSTTAVGAQSLVMLTIQVTGGTIGSVYISSRVENTSFTISSTSSLDTSTVGWLIVDPS